MPRRVKQTNRYRRRTMKRGRKKRTTTRRRRTVRNGTSMSRMPRNIRTVNNPGENTVMKQLAVLKNPFSTATQHPKIPDGKAQSSLSRRMRATKEIQSIPILDQTVPIHIVMLPILGCPVVAFTCENEAPFKAKAKYFFFDGAKLGYKYGERRSTGITDLPAFYWRFNNSEISQWRIVSEGLRLQLMNTVEENDGWYEACRFNPREWVSDFSVMPQKPSGDYTSIPVATTSFATDVINSSLQLVPDADMINGYLANTNLATQPGYETGLLKDIHKKMFHLAPHGCESDFCVLKETGVLGLAPSGGSTETPASSIAHYAIDETQISLEQRLSLARTQLEAKELVDNYFDRSWDAVYIRIHPRSIALGGSKLLAQVVQNLELCYPPNETLAEYQQMNYRHHNIEKIMDSMNNDYSPSTRVVDNPLLSVNNEEVPVDPNRNANDFAALSTQEKMDAIDIADVNAMLLPKVDVNDLKKRADILSHNVTKEDATFWEDFIDNADLADFRANAYRSEAGYSIRYNALTGENEMFIAGTRMGSRLPDLAGTVHPLLMLPTDWLSNIAEGGERLVNNVVTGGIATAGTFAVGPEVGATYNQAAMYSEVGSDISKAARQTFADFLVEEAEKYNVKVIYGHSRGAAILSDMKLDVVKVGLDGFTEVTDDINFINITNSGMFNFDRLISKRKGRLELDKRKFHDVTEKSRFVKKQKNEIAENVRKKANYVSNTYLPKKRIQRTWEVVKKVVPKIAKRQAIRAATGAVAGKVAEGTESLARSQFPQLMSQGDSYLAEVLKHRDALRAQTRNYLGMQNLNNHEWQAIVDRLANDELLRDVNNTLNPNVDRFRPMPNAPYTPQPSAPPYEPYQMSPIGSPLSPEVMPAPLSLFSPGIDPTPSYEPTSQGIPFSRYGPSPTRTGPSVDQDDIQTLISATYKAVDDINEVLVDRLDLDHEITTAETERLIDKLIYLAKNTPYDKVERVVANELDNFIQTAVVSTPGLPRNARDYYENYYKDVNKAYRKGDMAMVDLLEAAFEGRAPMGESMILRGKGGPQKLREFATPGAPKKKIGRKKGIGPRPKALYKSGKFGRGKSRRT